MTNVGWEGAALADLKTERAGLVSTGRRIETESAPIRYVAELLGADTDSERAIRWLIALMMLTCDPLAICVDSERGIGPAVNKGGGTGIPVAPRRLRA